jgi:hypothetical protein
MYLVKTEFEKEEGEEEPNFIFCQECLKNTPLISESIITYYNFHTNSYTGFCFNMSCKKRDLSQ